MLNCGNALNTAQNVDICLREREDFLLFFSPLANIRQQYAAEITPAAYRKVARQQADRQEICAWGGMVQNNFVQAMPAGAESGQAFDAVADMLRFMENYFFLCDEEMLWNIYELYFENGQQVDKIMPGLAVYVSDAVFNYMYRSAG